MKPELTEGRIPSGEETRKESYHLVDDYIIGMFMSLRWRACVDSAIS
jgi:hypothetical protein